MPNITCSALLPCTTEQEKQKHLKSDVHAVNHGIAFAELVSYIEEVRKDNLVAPVFKPACRLSESVQYQAETTWN